MKITRTVHERTDTGRIPRQTVTVEIEPGDDRLGFLNGIIERGSLTAILRLYGAVGRPLIEDDQDLYDLLTEAGYAERQLHQHVESLIWQARDTCGMSLGDIATALDRPRSSIASILDRVRRNAADKGSWRDADGLHRTTPDEAHARAAARAKELDRTPGPRT